MQINNNVWFNGNRVTIITESYELHGGMFQDAICNGKKITIPTQEQQEKDTKENQAVWQEQQARFRKLKDVQNV